MNIVEEYRFLLFDLYLTSLLTICLVLKKVYCIPKILIYNINMFFVKLTDSQNNCRTDHFINIKL